MSTRAQGPAPAGVTSASEGEDSSEGAIILLRNGQLLRGFLQLEGDAYLIDLGNGSSVRLPRTDIALICGSLAEAYQMQNARINPSDFESRLTLARWCLHQQLFNEAAEQLRIAENLNPQNVRVARIRQLLEIERANALAARIDAALPAPAASPVHLEEQLPPIEREGEVEGSNEFVRRAARIDQLPPGSLETFSRVAQPILLNGCTATACHGAHSESDFRLASFGDGLRFTQASTRENLASVLSLIDPADPPASPLLAAPGTPGVCTPEGVWSGAYDARPRQLLEWIEQCYPPAVETVAPGEGLGAQSPADGSAEPGVPASVPRLLTPGASESATPLPPDATGQGRGSSFGEDSHLPRTDVTPRHLPTPAAAYATQAAYDALLTPPDQPPAGPTRSAPPLEAGARDAFDAEIFHRRLRESSGSR